ncbi:hypothetical protein Taro_054440, partial [Colocasia esculenta]|nr:hypothetical protein [Colocasia esculenta]
MNHQRIHSHRGVHIWSHMVTPVFREPLCPGDPWVAARPSGVPSGGSGMSGHYSGIRAQGQGSNEICNELITMAVPKK